MQTKTVRALFERQVEAFTGSPEFAALEAGCGDYDAFIENVARAHLKSPQLVAFLYALAPPAAARDLLGNLLEELGLEAESERPHPALLEDLLRAGGPGARVVHPPLGGGRAPRRAGAGRSRSVRRLLRVHRRRGADDRRDDAARERVHAALLPRRDRGGDAAMRLVGATLYALRIPFVEAFSHSATERRWSDSVVVRVRDDAGTEGFGEGAPRPYVTGETVETMLEHLGRDLWPRVAGRDLPPAGHLPGLATFLPETYLAGALAPNAARAALELAMLDCALRRVGRPMASVLPPRRTRVTYSGVVTSGSVERAVQHARRMRAIGLRHVKVKVGFDDDVARVTAVREALGPDVSLRLDANGAWTFERAVAVLDAVAPLGTAAGVGVQVGSQVGETAILAAAGRHLAAALPEVAFVEGSFGTLLLAEDVSIESVHFGHRGEAPLLTGPGLGIRVVEERLRRRAITVRELSTEG